MLVNKWGRRSVPVETCFYCNRPTDEKVYGGASPEAPGIFFAAHKRCRFTRHTLLEIIGTVSVVIVFTIGTTSLSASPLACIVGFTLLFLACVLAIYTGTQTECP